MILGKRVRLRAVERSDLPRFVAWLNDAQVTRGLLVALPLSSADEEKWFDTMQARPLEEHTLAIEVDMEGGWMHVGNCGFHNLDWRNRSVELGLFIGEKQLWGQGYGSDVLRLLLRHGFNTLNLNRIYLQVFENNLGAIRSYEKVGFVHEGRLRQDIFKEGQYLDVLVMSVLRSEWQDSEV